MSWLSLVKASAGSCSHQNCRRMIKWQLAAVCLGLFALAATPLAEAQIDRDASSRVRRTNIPIAFEPNVGQAAAGESYFVRSGALQLGFSSGTVQMHVPSKKGSHLLGMQFVGSARNVQLRPESKTQGESNYFLGNDPAKWMSHIPQYARLNYSQIYPGIDLTFYGNGGRLEHDFVVQPGADYRQIRMRYRGARGLSITPRGDLSIKTADGEVLVHAPYVYQKANDETRQIRGTFVLLAKNEAGFRIESFDRSLPLVIDPVVDYSTFLGDAYVFVDGAAVDAAGNTYIVGQTSSPAYPVTAGAFQGGCPACPSNSDLFITKLNPTGTGQVYSTFLGGSGYQAANGIALDSNGNVLVTGWTGSADFPMKNPISSGVASYTDGFITSLSADGSSLNFSSRLGGSSSAGLSADTYPGAVAVDVSGNVYVAGTTESSFLPVTPGTLNAGTPSYFSGYFVFLVKLTSAGAETYGAILGATGSASLCCSIGGMTVDANQNVYLAGTIGIDSITNLPVWPITAGAYQTQMISPGQIAPFVAEVSSDASKFIYSTLATTGKLDAVTWNSKHEAILAGSPGYNLPLTADAFGTHTGTSFIAKMNADGTGLLYSTYLSTATADTGEAIYNIALDASENVWLAGNTLPYTSGNLPLVNPVISRPGNTSGFVTEFDPAIHNILFSTYFNGPSGAHNAGLGFDGSGHVHVAGHAPYDFPTTPGAFITAVGPPPPNVFPTYGFAAVIDPTTPGPSICSSGGTAQRTQVGSTGQGSFNITNCGNAPLQISSVQSTGSTVFAALSANACVGSLAAGASCNFGFTFTPTAAGTVSGSFSVASDAPFSTYSVAVTGTGTVPIIAINSQSITFATQVYGDSATAVPGAELVINRGSAPLVINLAQSTISGPFTTGLTSCNNPVPAGSSCSIRLNFVPTAAGTSTGTFSIVSNDPANPTVNISLSGTAVAAYPQPTISGLNPSAVALGGAAKTITISGANFFPTSTVVVAGQTLPVTSAGPVTLSFTLDPSLVTTVGEIPILVINPSPGGASASYPLTVYRTVPVSAASLVYNAANQLLYASIPSSSTTNPNTVVSIDPATGNVGTPIPVGNNPGKLALSSDGAYLYVGSNGDHTLQRINLSTSQVERTFPLPADETYGATRIFNMQSVPGAPTSVVAGLLRTASPGEAGAVLYNDAGQVSFLGNTFQNNYYDIDSFTFTSDATVFYAYPFGSSFFSITGVSSSGLTVISRPGFGCCNQTTGSIVASDGTLLYTNSGQVWNPSTQTLLGTYSNTQPLFYEPSVVPDTPGGHTFFLDSGSGSAPLIMSYDQGSYAGPAGSLSVNGTYGAGSFLDLARWGVDGFAFRVFSEATTDQVVILRSSLAKAKPGEIPTLANLSPSSIAQGAPDTQMTVTGTKFVLGAKVQWNGQALETTYQSSTQLIALIPSNQLAAAGSAQVTVANPAPGGVSSALTFTIGLPAPSLVLAAIPNHTFGDQPFTVSATSNSTAAITYSVQSGPASISGTTVTITGAGTVVVTATQAATTSFSTTTATASFQVAKAQPVISWATPAAIAYGTPLSSLQLNATANVPGTFTYTPAAGAILGLGSNNLSVTFTPTDAVNYRSATSTVTIAVNQPVPTITSLNPPISSAGGATFALTVNGAGFTPSSVVKFKGTALSTIYVSGTQLTAQVPAANIANAGQQPVTVQNPAPGGGASNAFQFEIDSAGSTSLVVNTTTATVAHGATANYALTLPSGTTNVSASCLNLPAGASCSYSATNNSVSIATSSSTPAGTYQIVIVLTETLPGVAAAWLLPIFILPLYSVAKRRGAQRFLFVLCIAIVLSFAVSAMGCGGGSGGGGSTPVQPTHQTTSSGLVTLIVQ